MTYDSVVPRDRTKIHTTYSCPVCGNSNFLEIVSDPKAQLEITTVCPRCRIASVHYRNEEGHQALAIYDFRHKPKNVNNKFTTNSTNNPVTNLSVA